MKRKTLLLNATVLTLLVAAPVATAQSKWPVFNGKSQSGEAMTIDPARGVLTMAPLLERTTPAVVNISVSSTVRVPTNPFGNDEFIERFFGDRIPGFGNRDNDNDDDDETNERTTRSAGSGVIINAGKGYVLTNHHVVDKADKITVTLTDRDIQTDNRFTVSSFCCLLLLLLSFTVAWLGGWACWLADCLLGWWAGAGRHVDM